MVVPPWGFGGAVRRLYRYDDLGVAQIVTDLAVVHSCSIPVHTARRLPRFAPDGLQKGSTLGSAIWSIRVPSWSGVEGCEVEAGEACGVEEDVHGRDPPVPQREGGDRVGFPVEQCDPAGRAVDKRGPRDEAELRGGPRPAGDVLGAANLQDGPAAGVHAFHDVGIEHGDEGVEVSVARGGEEGCNDLLLCGRVGVGGRVRTADAAASAAGELARRVGRAVEDGADLVEGN